MTMDYGADPLAALQLAELAGRLQQGQTQNLPGIPASLGFTGADVSTMLQAVYNPQGVPQGTEVAGPYVEAGLPIAPLLAGAAKVLGPVLGKVPGWAWSLLAGGAGSLLGGALGGGAEGDPLGQPTIPGTDIILQGPGAPEPYPKMIVKEWAGIGGSRFYLLINGRVAVRKRNGVWRIIRRPAMLHMKLSNPRLGDVAKADRAIQQVVKVVRRRLPSARRATTRRS